MQEVEPPQNSSSLRPLYAQEGLRVVMHVAMFFGYLLVCCAFYSSYEGWIISESIMFSLATMTTIGYGYSEPSDDHSRLFTIFAMIIGVFLIFGSINDLVVNRIQNMNKHDEAAFAEMTQAEIYRHHQRALAITIFFIVFFLFIAAGIFSAIEDWTFVKGLYFAVQTATTVGYGDLNLLRNGTNYFLGFYIMLSTTLLCFAFNHFRTLHEDFRKLKETAKFAEKKQTLAKLKELDQGSGVPMNKFILAVLVQLGKLDQHNDIDPWIKKFREIDTNNSGTIDSNEIEMFSHAEADQAAAQLEALRQLTAGANNVAWASLNDMTTNVVDVLNLNGERPSDMVDSDRLSGWKSERYTEDAFRGTSMQAFNNPMMEQGLVMSTRSSPTVLSMRGAHAEA